MVGSPSGGCGDPCSESRSFLRERDLSSEGAIHIFAVSGRGKLGRCHEIDPRATLLRWHMRVAGFFGARGGSSCLEKVSRGSLASPIWGPGETAMWTPAGGFPAPGGGGECVRWPQRPARRESVMEAPT